MADPKPRHLKPQERTRRLPRARPSVAPRGEARARRAHLLAGGGRALLAQAAPVEEVAGLQREGARPLQQGASAVRPHREAGHSYNSRPAPLATAPGNAAP